jgi:hypothetical protein
MLTYDQALKLMQDSADSLHRSGLSESLVVVSQATVLLGSESSLDSMALVTFISDLEERVSRAVNKELYLVLTDIHEFNHDKGELSADTLARHIVAMANK